MALNKKIMVFDFETDGPNPEICQPVQVAALVLDPRNLSIVPGSEFNSFMRPEGIDNEDYLNPTTIKTIEWHAKNRQCSTDDILDAWREYPSQKIVWEQFYEYCMRYNPNRNLSTAPIPCGANIEAFDLVIVDRLNEKYNKGTMFWRRDTIDIQHVAWLWLAWIDGPKNIKMDTLKDYFGLENEERHDALADVKEEAWFAQKFLGLHQNMSPRVDYHGLKKKAKTELL